MTGRPSANQIVQRLTDMINPFKAAALTVMTVKDDSAKTTTTLLNQALEITRLRGISLNGKQPERERESELIRVSVVVQKGPCL